MNPPKEHEAAPPTRYVGASVDRPEGRAKVTGRGVYVADLHVKDAWIGAAVRSPVASGILREATPASPALVTLAVGVRF